MMESLTRPGFSVFYDSEERQAAERIADACEEILHLLQDLWGLETPKDLRVYVMVSYLPFILHSPPWFWWPLLVWFLPFTYLNARRLWRYAGGWAQRYGSRNAIGIKAPNVLQAANTTLGKRIFIQEDDIDKKIKFVTCHELTHAATSHLRLPKWLFEGLAMLAVDKYFGHATVRTDTLQSIMQAGQNKIPGKQPRLSKHDQDGLIYYVVRGYWLTKYIEETRPELLESLLREPQGSSKSEKMIATAYGMDVKEFWGEIEARMAAHFAAKDDRLI